MAADIKEEARAQVRAEGAAVFNPLDKDCAAQIKKASVDGAGVYAVLDFVGSTQVCICVSISFVHHCTRVRLHLRVRVYACACG
jgi:threonine dehydrogenase-like Zn-dependent dehydrogenase